MVSHLWVLDDQLGKILVLSPEDDSSDKVGQDSSGLVFAVSGGRD